MPWLRKNDCSQVETAVPIDSDTETAGAVDEICRTASLPSEFKEHLLKTQIRHEDSSCFWVPYVDDDGNYLYHNQPCYVFTGTRDEALKTAGLISSNISDSDQDFKVSVTSDRKPTTICTTVTADPGGIKLIMSQWMQNLKSSVYLGPEQQDVLVVCAGKSGGWTIPSSEHSSLETPFECKCAEEVLGRNRVCPSTIIT
uniref:START domain-containing protein n=1 Tax=Ascaris lumbricoides TaxID=6252 RepID=A0A0M3IBP3_ASCLU